MKKELDSLAFHRQIGLVDPKKLYDLRVRIIGVGAIGSMVAIALAKMGVGSIELWDPDTVEKHNLPNQFYRTGDLGKPKVEALTRTLTEDFGAFEVTPFHSAYSTKDASAAALPNAQVVVCAVDSMEFRKDLWENGIRNRYNPKLYIETRMGGEEFRIYSLDPMASETHSAYESELYSTGEADATPCTERSILYNVMVLGGLVASYVKKYAVEDKDIPFETLGDFRNNLFYFNSAPKPTPEPVS